MPHKKAQDNLFHNDVGDQQTQSKCHISLFVLHRTLDTMPSKSFWVTRSWIECQEKHSACLQWSSVEILSGSCSPSNNRQTSVYRIRHRTKNTQTPTKTAKQGLEFRALLSSAYALRSIHSSQWTSAQRMVQPQHACSQSALPGVKSPQTHTQAHRTRADRHRRRQGDEHTHTPTHTHTTTRPHKN